MRRLHVSSVHCGDEYAFEKRFAANIFSSYIYMHIFHIQAITFKLIYHDIFTT